MDLLPSSLAPDHDWLQSRAIFIPETAPRDDESHIRNRATEASYWHDRSNQNATLRPMSRVDPEMAAHDRVFNGAVVASKRFHSANGTRFAVSLYLRPHRCSSILHDTCTL